MFIFIFIYTSKIKFSGFDKRPEQEFQSLILWKLGVNDGVS